ncbi:hypothetical protein F4825DRAFT_271360 [Nemania diffusa]|nr:hypothetical protein F4825DRAFT_271360 [Nemania diffusa]
MAGSTRGMHPWGQIYLGDNSIFCAAPLPSSPDDIICPGSDDGNDEATTTAKRLRYEDHGRRYLQGRPLPILSAFLRGPFSRVSGWQNPWLPKQSSHNIQCLDNLPQLPVISSTVHSQTDVPAERQSSEESGTVQDVYDSMDCHLPSPQSHEDLQFFDSPSRTERCSRVKSWADNVCEDILETDDFWAPSHAVGNHHIESAAKRPAERDWLKRRPAKRRKPYASQSTEASYTPTPRLPAQVKVKNRKDSLLGRPVNRSFEMTTPSSSPGQGPSESPGLVDDRQAVPYEKEVGEKEQHHPSATSPGASWSSTDPPTQSREEERGEVEVEDRGNGETENPSPVQDVCQDQSQKHGSRSGEDAEDAIGFQDCADESFFYRTRQAKQATPPVASNATTTGCLSQGIQTKEAISPKYDDAILLPSNRDIQSPISNTASAQLNTSNDKHVEKPNKSSIGVTVDNESGHSAIPSLELDHNLLQSQEAVFQSYGITDKNANTDCGLGVGTGRSLVDITSDARLNVCNAIPQTILEVKEAQGTSPSALLDDGPTLIGDPMDTEELGDIESPPQDLIMQSGHSSLLQHYALSATNLANASQASRCSNVTVLTKPNDNASCTTSTRPQHVATELQLTTSKPTSQSSQRGLMDSVTCADAIMSQDNGDIPQIIADCQNVSADQQDPMVPLCISNESVEHSNDSIEQAEDKPEELPVKSNATFPSPPVVVHYSPTIRPSQQSPWVQEVTEPANRVILEGTPSMSTARTLTVESPEIPQRLLLAANEECLSWPVSPFISPVSGREHQHLGSHIVAEGRSIPSIQDLPYTPTPQVARQSTPDGDLSIRSFSNFNFSSPQQSVCPPRSSTSRSILSVRKYTSSRASEKSNKRVLFAPLPHEQENNNSQPSTKLRAASPPPPALVDIEEEDVNGRYRNHFDVMNRRLTENRMSNLRYHHRILPSSSQQKPESPSIEAMADAFREADAQRLDYNEDVVESTEMDEREADGTEVQETEERPQSPWQQDSEGIDDVAAVMGNLPDFLDVWDVNVEIDRNRAELNEVESHGALSNTDMGILRGVGIW